MYKIKFRKPISYDFDLIVIGSGTGGSLAAHTASGLGKKVCIVESDKIGGQCPNSTCIPTKSLLEVAKTLETIETAPRHGIVVDKFTVNYESVKQWVKKAVDSTGVNQEFLAYKEDKINLIKGHAHFISPWQISVGLRRYTAKNFIIATGSRPYIPNINGLEDSGYLTYDNLFNSKNIIKSLTIIGGGAIAYEYAQICTALGTKIHVIESADHILPNEDPEISDIAESQLTDRGARVHTNAKIEYIGPAKHGKVISFIQHGQKHRIITDDILVASGKMPNIDIGLENTGVKYTDFGILVNNKQRTNQKHIYAVGDVTGQNLSTHMAAYESRIAIHNMFRRKKIALLNHAIPRVIYGMPEIAVVGKNERQIKMSGVAYQTAIAPIGIVGKSFATDYDSGFVKIIANYKGVIIGASIVAPHASEMISELTLAINFNHRACDLANTIHPFPTWSEAVRVASSKILCI